MTVLRAIRQLVLGETWTLPLGLLAVLLTGVALRAAVPGVWRDVGGLILLAGVVLTLVSSVRIAAEPARPPRSTDESR